MLTGYILITERLDDAPFDLRGQRLIVYRYDPDGMLKLKEDLENAIFAVSMNNSRDVDNPVQRYLLTQSNAARALERDPSNRGVIDDILSEISDLRNEVRNYAGQARQVDHVSNILQSIEVDNLPADAETLKAFRGIWLDRVSGSTLYVRIHNGRLLVPYCYAGYDEMAGVFFLTSSVLGAQPLRASNGFKSPISGFAYMELVDSDRIEGGWWYSHRHSQKTS